MSVSFRITSEGGLAIERKLAGLVNAFGNLEPLMDYLGAALESSTIHRFEEERGPDGQRWKPSQRAIADAGKTLTDSGQLRSSITRRTSSDRVEIGTNKIYAGIHQFGSQEKVQVGAHTRTRKSSALPGGLTYSVAAFERQNNMPARPFLGLSSEDESELLATTADWVRLQLGDTA